MESINLAAVFILFVLFTETYEQEITSLKIIPNSSACFAPGAVEADVDKIGVEVRLNSSTLKSLAFMWNLLDVVSASETGNTKRLLATVYLRNCSSSQSNVTVMCSVEKEMTSLSLLVPAFAELSNTTLFVVWRNRHNNFVHSYYEKTPSIITRHKESLQVNDIDIQLENTPLSLNQGIPLNVRYCVENLGPHVLGMVLGHVAKNVSNAPCVSEKFDEVHLGSSLSLYFNETSGGCLRFKKRFISLTGNPEKAKATSDSTALRPVSLEWLWSLANVAVVCPLLTLHRLGDMIG